MILFWSKSEQGRELSNFAPARIEIEIYQTLYRFRSAEAAYQAHKVAKDEIGGFQTLTAIEAKNKAKILPVRSDWLKWRDRAMRRVLDVKFSQPKFKKILLDTGDEELVHWAPWDLYWGVTTVTVIQGENNLGKMLMEIRHDLQAK